MPKTNKPTPAAVRKRLVKFVTAITAETYEKSGAASVPDKPTKAMEDAVRVALEGMSIAVTSDDFAVSLGGHGRSFVLGLKGEFGRVGLLFSYNAKVGAKWPEKPTTNAMSVIRPEFATVISDGLDERGAAN